MVQDQESIVIDNSMQQSESEVQLVDPPEQFFDANDGLSFLISCLLSSMIELSLPLSRSFMGQFCRRSWPGSALSSL